ncbi:hypothetical protein CANCADRAFT_30245 [Tortispora caseinolytica NRRL Y-17796]|uniref:Uncharacterized protein n=1 Tax=Tortispora caseinolytica NRRL Y-17796 TaxID=767744 RepID=A0A1E4TJK3_9ASCO|nr:hypothetical protein CANCADRAFT_30245 [Tortispora caseinolytica NRRL Y-17796]
MCMETTCGKCKGKTWYGCGQHIPSVMDNIDPKEWCSCDKGGSKYPPKGEPPH